MSVDELRQGLARLAGTVVPDADPYGRFLRHARRRRRRRLAGFGAAVAALLATATAVPAALTGAAPDHGPDEVLLHGHRVDSPWTWDLIESPVRGSLAGDRAFLAETTRLFDRERDRLMIGPDLPTVRVLFADDSAGFRQVVVAYHSASHATLVTREARRGATPGELLDGGGSSNERPAPFTVLGVAAPDRPAQWVLGLAPAGCVMAYAPTAALGENGAQRPWRPAPGGSYLLVEGAFAAPGWWRVTCAGKVRRQGPIGQRYDVIDRSTLDPLPPFDARPSPAPTIDEWRVGRDAAGAYRELTGRAGLGPVGDPVIRWAGRVSAGGDEAAVVGPTGAGPVVLQVGAGDGMLATRVDAARATAAGPGTSAGPPLVATGRSIADGVAVVRVPARDGDSVVVTDRLLVLPRPGAVRVEAVGGDGSVIVDAPVVDGAAILPLRIGTPVTLRGRDRSGAVDLWGPLREPADGERIFDEPVVSDW